MRVPRRRTLQDFEVLEIFIFGVGIEVDLAHRQILWSMSDAKHSEQLYLAYGKYYRISDIMVPWREQAYQRLLLRLSALGSFG